MTRKAISPRLATNNLLIFNALCFVVQAALVATACEREKRLAARFMGLDAPFGS